MDKKEIKEYIQEQAENYGVPYDTALAIFELLGESEMYDGFISAMEDYALNEY